MLGAFGAVSGTVTYFADRQQQRNADDLGTLRNDMNRLMAEQEDERKRRKDTLPTDPTIFRAQVTRRVVGTWAFDGPLALTAVKTGDIVDVLEVDTGPDNSYHRCRAETQAGLYPKHFLERVLE